MEHYAFDSCFRSIRGLKDTKSPDSPLRLISPISSLWVSVKVVGNHRL